MCTLWQWRSLLPKIWTNKKVTRNVAKNKHRYTHKHQQVFIMVCNMYIVTTFDLDIAMLKYKKNYNYVTNF